MDVTLGCKTHVGMLRSRNEDNYTAASDIGLFMVADGMGGHKGGDEASRLACIVVEDYIRSKYFLLEMFGKDPNVGRYDVMRILRDAVRLANEKIVLEAQIHPEFEGMATTTAVLLLLGGRAFVANVGDSRIYLLRGGVTTLITEDHSLLFEFIRQGRMTKSQAAKFPYKNIVTRAVGMRGDVAVDILDFEVLPNDRFIVCSDGLHSYLEDEQIYPMIEGLSPEEAVNILVDHANNSGGGDNITVIVVDVHTIDGDPGQVIAKNNIIRSFPIFTGLSHSELIRVVSSCDIIVVPERTVLFREGPEGDAMYGVISGAVDIWRGGKPILKFGPGTHFGEMCLVEGKPRLATGIVREQTELLVFSRKRFFMLSKKFPSLATKLLRNLVLILAARLRNTNDELLILKEQFDASGMITPSVVPTDILQEEE